MKNLEKEYDINRYDIKTSEKLILKKYSETIKSHQHFDIRLEHYTMKEIIIINQKSLKKIFSLAKEIPEEHILFLYMGESGNNKNNNFLPPIDTSLLINNFNNSDMRLDNFNLKRKNQEQGEIIVNPKISQYLCIFSILFFIMAGLLLIHFLQFIFSEQVR
jgi:hypothetical protein